jgi:hypothetical protein
MELKGNFKEPHHGSENMFRNPFNGIESSPNGTAASLTPCLLNPFNGIERGRPGST